MMRRFLIVIVCLGIFTACDTLLTIPTGDTMPSNLNGQIAQGLNTLRASPQTCSTTAIGPGPALTWSNKLAKAAEVQAKDLIASNRLNRIGKNDVNVNNRCKLSESPNALLDPHCHSDGSGIDDRVIATGYDFAGQAFRTSEIIALTNKGGIQISSIATQQSDASSEVKRAVQGWLKSPAHCTEMLRPKNRQIGVYNQEVGEGVYVWVAVFAGTP